MKIFNSITTKEYDLIKNISSECWSLGELKKGCIDVIIFGVYYFTNFAMYLFLYYKQRVVTATGSFLWAPKHDPDNSNDLV